MSIDDLQRQGSIGGKTARIVESGIVECAAYPVAPLEDGFVRIGTVRTAVSPGTEMTFIGRDASNVYLHRRWNEELRLFEAGPPSLRYPIAFGYRAAGAVIESRASEVKVGDRIFGNWHHTEFTVLPAAQARAQTLPDALSWDDGVDIGQMGPIALNAVAFAEGEQRDAPTVVFGAGPVGLLTAQIARASGAGRVIVVDRIPSRLAIAERLRLEPLEAAEGVDVAATLKRSLGADAIAVAFECTGSNLALHEAIRVVRRRGLVVAVGFYQGGSADLRLGEEFHHNGVRITCGQIGNIHPDHDWSSLRAEVLRLCADGSVALGTLPRSTVPIESIAEGIASLRRPDEVLQVAVSYAQP